MAKMHKIFLFLVENGVAPQPPQKVKMYVLLNMTIAVLNYNECMYLIL